MNLKNNDEMDFLYSLSKEELVEIIIDDAKNWLAHDGLWFQEVEKIYGMDAAMDADRSAWKRFARIEATRIMKRLGIQPGGGIPALLEAVKYRLYARINLQEIKQISDSHALFRIIHCRVQSARKRKGLPDFPCKSVAVVQFSEFASTIDPRITTTCKCCPPDEHGGDYWCEWEFRIAETPEK